MKDLTKLLIVFIVSRMIVRCVKIIHGDDPEIVVKFVDAREEQNLGQTEARNDKPEPEKNELGQTDKKPEKTEAPAVEDKKES